jgi:hypothetical protein
LLIGSAKQLTLVLRLLGAFAQLGSGIQTEIVLTLHAFVQFEVNFAT